MLSALAIATTLAAPAHAEVARFAVVVGNNVGASDSAPLLFAEQDAQRMRQVLNRLGGVEGQDTTVLLGVGRNRLLRELAALRSRVAEAAARGDETIVVFYYSGHADERRLQLGRTWVSWPELRDLLSRTEADVRVAFVDACRSGSLTRLKGASRAPGFVVDLRERTDARGQVIITSSSADEASQESEEIAGSYFTWALVNALSGSADADADGQVTLLEAWSYVRDETAFRTANSRAGAQHPTYAWELSGTGDVVLSDLGQDAATLRFPAGTTGRFAVFDLDRRAFVAEVSVEGVERPLSLSAGHYLVQQRHPTHLEVAELRLGPGDDTTLQPDGFAAVEYEDDRAKGAIDGMVRQARRPDLTLLAQAGGRQFLDDEVAQAYLPATTAFGLGARWTWAEGTWASADVTIGAAQAEVVLDGLPYGVPVDVQTQVFGGAFGLGTRPGRLLAAGVGARLSAIHVQRRFDGASLGPQSLLTVTPGLTGRLGLRPGPVTVEAELRGHYLPYRIDERDQGVAFAELLLTTGLRF